MAGTKTTGIAYGGLLSLWMLFELRGNRRLQMALMGSLTAALLLFGSVETYVESMRVFRHPLGPPEIVREHRNCDGFRGGAANFSRYVMGSLYVGQSNWQPSTDAIARMASIEYALLDRAGLIDAGINVHCPDRKLFFYQSGMEELSGFGPLGAAGIGLMLAACFCWRPKDTWWQLTAITVFGLALTSMMIAYMRWNNRFLIGHFALTTIACACMLWQVDSPWRRTLRWGFVALAVTCATAAPLVSFNRGPSSLIAAIRDRQHFETCMVPVIGKVLTRLHELRATGLQGRVIVAAYQNPAVLHYLTKSDLKIVIVPVNLLERLLNNGELVDGDTIVMETECTFPTLVKLDTITAPNAMNGASDGTSPPLVRHIYRVRRDKP